MRRRDNAHVHRHDPRATHRGDLAFLQDAQDLGLGCQRHVADFIQEQRAALGFAKAAGAVAGGAGISAFDVAEQFAFHQLDGNRGAIDGHERSRATRAVAMQGARDQFLAGSGLS
ncbi:hypothetical protein D3C87_1905380 [compost metagenome]